jgi:hypothetical protein
MAATTSPHVEFDTRSDLTVMVLTEVEPKDGRYEAMRLLPVQGITPEPPVWERIAVSAGIDREARELSEAETLLADFRAARG